MWTRTQLLSFLVAASTLVPAAAHAANPGVGHGTLMISAERLFGLSVVHSTVGTGGGEASFDQTHFGLALAPFAAASPSPTPSVYTFPRLALDFAVIDGLTVGGSLGFAFTDTSSDPGGAGPSFTTFLIAPRIGYVLGLNRTVQLWLRGGLTYFNASRHVDPSTLPPNTDRSSSRWGISLNLEPTLMIAPFDHVAFTASVLFDIPVAGKQSNEVTAGSVTTTTSADATDRNIGLVAGIVVMF
jgi:hypothetical protein